MRLINLFERWTRFSDKFPKHKSNIIIYDGNSIMQMREFNIVKTPGYKDSYFFWFIGCNIGKDDEEDRYPLWMYLPKTKFKSRYNRETDRIEAY